jgi:hypothetical protein
MISQSQNGVSLYSTEWIHPRQTPKEEMTWPSRLSIHILIELFLTTSCPSWGHDLLTEVLRFLTELQSPVKSVIIESIVSEKIECSDIREAIRNSGLNPHIVKLMKHISEDG